MIKEKTLLELQNLKKRGEKIAMLTVYDATFARIASEAQVDCLLVGDSLGSVIQGHENTVPVTVADIAYHTNCVVRGNRGAFVIADAPFMSCATLDRALLAAQSFMQAGAAMVKIEGDAWLCPIISALTERGIPVCAHVGLQPQSVHLLGGYRVQGKEPVAAKRIIETARVLESAGAAMIVLECVPAVLGEELTSLLRIPVIGIGAGNACDGQVLVLQDMLGLNAKPPKFARNFMHEKHSIAEAIAAYVKAVKVGAFPNTEENYSC